MNCALFVCGENIDERMDEFEHCPDGSVPYGDYSKWTSYFYGGLWAGYLPLAKEIKYPDDIVYSDYCKNYVNSAKYCDINLFTLSSAREQHLKNKWEKYMCCLQSEENLTDDIKKKIKDKYEIPDGIEVLQEYLNYEEKECFVPYAILLEDGRWLDGDHYESFNAWKVAFFKYWANINPNTQITIINYHC